jgi:hypothetical protein
LLQNGLIDIAVSIVIGDLSIGNFSTGQFFSAKPSFHHFKQKTLGACRAIRAEAKIWMFENRF